MGSNNFLFCYYPREQVTYSIFIDNVIYIKWRVQNIFSSHEGGFVEKQLRSTEID